MPRGWERAHVGSDLSDHGLGGGRTKPRHLLQPLDDVMKGRQRGLNAGVEGCNAVLQLLNRPQMLTEQESMMLPDTAGENFQQEGRAAGAPFPDALLKATSGGRQAPASELITGSIPRAVPVRKPPSNDQMAAFLSPASTQLTALMQSTAVDRGPVPLPRPRPKRL